MFKELAYLLYFAFFGIQLLYCVMLRFNNNFKKASNFRKRANDMVSFGCSFCINMPNDLD